MRADPKDRVRNTKFSSGVADSELNPHIPPKRQLWTQPAMTPGQGLTEIPPVYQERSTAGHWGWTDTDKGQFLTVRLPVDNPQSWVSHTKSKHISAHSRKHHHALPKPHGFDLRQQHTHVFNGPQGSRARALYGFSHLKNLEFYLSEGKYWSLCYYSLE